MHLMYRTIASYFLIKDLIFQVMGCASFKAKALLILHP